MERTAYRLLTRVWIQARLLRHGWLTSCSKSSKSQLELESRHRDVLLKRQNYCNTYHYFVVGFFFPKFISTLNVFKRF